MTTAPSGPAGDTILIVDDDPLVRATLQEFLVGRGYAVETAPDSHGATARLASNPRIRMVLTDVVMPGPMNGFELHDWAAKARPDVVVVLMSGYPIRTGVSEDVPRPVRVLRKPLALRELGDEIRRLLATPDEAPPPGGSRA